MGTIGIVISSRCKKYINIYIYIYMSKGRKCKKEKKKKVIAAVGAVMAVKCPRPPEVSD